MVLLALRWGKSSEDCTMLAIVSHRPGRALLQRGVRRDVVRAVAGDGEGRRKAAGQELQTCYYHYYCYCYYYYHYYYYLPLLLLLLLHLLPLLLLVASRGGGDGSSSGDGGGALRYAAAAAAALQLIVRLMETARCL